MRFAAHPPARGFVSLHPGGPFSESDRPVPCHPSPETLRRFAAGVASRAECREVVAHLLGCCTTCAVICRGSVDPLVQPADYEAVFDRCVARSDP